MAGLTLQVLFCTVDAEPCAACWKQVGFLVDAARDDGPEALWAFIEALMTCRTWLQLTKFTTTQRMHRACKTTATVNPHLPGLLNSTIDPFSPQQPLTPNLYRTALHLI
jgi:hypothetical protein